MSAPAPTDPSREILQALVIGSGPAGRMAAEVLSAAGVSVVVADQMPPPARKFLTAGKSGLNLTKEDDHLDTAYGDASPAFARAVSEFGPEDVVRWATGQGQETFVGSTGRVFPVAMKASPLRLVLASGPAGPAPPRLAVDAGALPSGVSMALMTADGFRAARRPLGAR